ncbi:endonuclease [Streptomyces sp. NPDC048436]|uniref:endonuclease n=1 Tax=Streptomyces sp. NPDC048436 TaxID=3365550 RepID=UPI00370FC6C0
MVAQTAVMRELMKTSGQTYAAEAGIRLTDTPQPLYRTLVLSCLLSARIRASVAVASTRALYEAGMRGPRQMADASWQQRVDALGRGGYRRYDERTATQLGDGAELVLDEWGGDLRRVRAEADGDTAVLKRRLRKVPGLGPTGADIFLREVQDVWTEYQPYLDPKVIKGAERLGLPENASGLMRLAGKEQPGVLAAALVRAALDEKLAKDSLDRAAAGGAS